MAKQKNWMISALAEFTRELKNVTSYRTILFVFFQRKKAKSEAVKEDDDDDDVADDNADSD